jgi:hemoglobin-like flavoprotein
MNASHNLIHRSFELAAARCEDLTPLVYRRLFREHPEAESMFRSEGSDLVKGSMLALTIDAMLDFAGDRTGHFRMISCEVQSHDATARRVNCSAHFSASSPIRCGRFWVLTGRLR